MKKFTIFLSCLVVFLFFGNPDAAKSQSSDQKDTIKVQIELPNGDTARQDTLTEGDTLGLKGLPFPLHIMNGGQLAFNDSSLTHDITITIKLPGFANVDSTKREVGFGDSLASGVRFTVSSADTVIDPFEFENPVDLTLPIPDDLPDSIGDQVSDFVLTYRDSTGSIDTTGIETTVSDTVKGIVSAEVSHFSDVVMTSSELATEHDTVTFEVITPKGDVARADSVAEGDTLTLTGMPFPLQYLNGSKLALPDSAVSEDVKISINIPEFANIDSTKQEISFGDSIASSVEFTVTKNDTVVEPFEFDTPVTLTLPVPKDLPNEIGDKVSSFVLAYRDTTGNIDTTGIKTTVADSVKGIVSAEVSHFSTIAMTTGDETTTDIDKYADGEPKQFKLEQNYPNPFNPVTTINYQLKEAEHVTLTVYNTLGRKVATLVDKQQRPGQYQVRFDASDLSSGIYMYRIEAGDFSSIHKMTVIK